MSKLNNKFLDIIQTNKIINQHKSNLFMTFMEENDDASLDCFIRYGINNQWFIHFTKEFFNKEVLIKSCGIDITPFFKRSFENLNNETYADRMFRDIYKYEKVNYHITYDGKLTNDNNMDSNTNPKQYNITFNKYATSFENNINWKKYINLFNTNELLKNNEKLPDDCVKALETVINKSSARSVETAKFIKEYFYMKRDIYISVQQYKTLINNNKLLSKLLFSNNFSNNNTSNNNNNEFPMIEQGSIIAMSSKRAVDTTHRTETSTNKKLKPININKPTNVFIDSNFTTIDVETVDNIEQINLEVINIASKDGFHLVCYNNKKILVDYNNNMFYYDQHHAWKPLIDGKPIYPSKYGGFKDWKCYRCNGKHDGKGVQYYKHEKKFLENCVYNLCTRPRAITQRYSPPVPPTPEEEFEDLIPNITSSSDCDEFSNELYDN